MTPLEAAICAKIAYLTDGSRRAAELGYSYEQITNRNARCWVGHKGGKTVVGIRGTVLFGGHRPNLDVSMQTDQVPWVGPGLVHEGFHKALWHVFGDLKQATEGRQEIYFTGHSMGGAIALLASALLPAVRVYCFASPRVGDEEFAACVGVTRRVTRYENRGDFLTKLPLKGAIKGGNKKLTGRYVHVGRTVRLLSFGHSMDAYLNGVMQRTRGR